MMNLAYAERLADLKIKQAVLYAEYKKFIDNGQYKKAHFYSDAANIVSNEIDKIESNFGI